MNTWRRIVAIISGAALSGSIGWRRLLYTFISGATPVATFFATADPMTTRKLASVLLFAVIAAATADRAFLDPSHHRKPGDPQTPEEK